MRKKDKDMTDMLANSAVNFGLLQPTVSGGGVPSAPAAVERQPEIKPAPERKTQGQRQEVQPKGGVEKQTKPTGHEKKPAENEGTAENPFGYSVGPTWPLVPYQKPFLIPTREYQARSGAALTVRIPVELSLTVDAHLAKLGVRNVSEWIRHAMERQLSLEQEYLSKK